MDKARAIKAIRETFENPFDKERFTYFIRELFNSIDDSRNFTYTGNYISSVTDPKNQAIIYTCNTNGDLTGVTYPGTDPASSLTYAYDANHHLTDKYDTGNNLVGHWEYTADGSGRVLTHHRFLKDGVRQELIDFAYNPVVNNTTVLTRSTGQTTLHLYIVHLPKLHDAA